MFPYEFCRDGIWNESEFANDNYPIVTECFQYSVLLVSSALFVVCFVIDITITVIIGRSVEWTDKDGMDEMIERDDRRCLFELGVRVTLIALLPVEALIDSLSLQTRQQADMLLIGSFSLLIAATLLSTIQTEIRRRTSNVICPLSFVFWLAVTLAYFVRFYGNIIRFVNCNKIELEFGFLLLSGLIFLIFLLNFVNECVPRAISKRLLKKKKMHCPEEYASVLSKLTYFWLDKFIYRWYKEEMTEETSFDIRLEDKCAINTNMVENMFLIKVSQNKEDKINETVTETTSNSSNLILEDKDENKINSRKVLFLSLMKTFQIPLVVAWSLKVISDLAIYTMPILLKMLMQTAQKGNMPNWMGYLFALAFLFCGTISSLSLNYCTFITTSIGIKIRAALSGMIYRKTLRLNNESRNKFTSGEITNLMSVDTGRIMQSIVSSWFLVSCPLQFLLEFILLYQELGNAVFAGLCVIIAFFPLNGFLMMFIYRFSDIELKWKDGRVKIITEILNGIKVLKMYAWEKFFLSKVTQIRNKEMMYIISVLLSYDVLNIIWEILPFIVVLSTFLTFIYTGGVNVITSERVFVSLSLFNLLRFAMLVTPLHLSEFIFAFVSLKRIGDYLIEEDFEKEDKHYFKSSVKENLNKSTLSGEPIVEIIEGYFSWKKDERIILKKINMQIPKGKLVAIVGKVGTGKSSLIAAILREMHIVSGSIKIRGTVAYVPQEAWIQNKSLKENILFTKNYNKNFYETVLKACSLEKDLEKLPGRDEAEIGERGINLSGGQKQRVSLARAVYQNRDLYLLDDPLSAVDAHVGQHLFENVISNNGMLRGKTRILVTHGINWLPKVDEVLVLDSMGHISERGSFKELLRNGDDFMQFIKENTEHNNYYTDKVNLIDLEDVTNLPKKKEHLKKTSNVDHFNKVCANISIQSPLKDNMFKEISDINESDVVPFCSQNCSSWNELV